MSRMEEYNYWNDPRTIAGMIPKPEIQDSKEWAERLVKDLAGDKGFNAVVAPRWIDE